MKKIIKTGFRKMTWKDIKRGIDLSKTISGFRVFISNNKGDIKKC